MRTLPQFDNTEIAFKHKSTGSLRQAQALFASMGSPFLTKWGTRLTSAALRLKLPVKGLIKNTLFKQFCGGESMEEAATTAAALTPYGIGVVLDYSVEGAEGEEAFDTAVPEFIRAIEYASSRPAVPFIAVKVTGFARFSLLEKVHSGEKLSEAETAEYDRVKNRILTICSAAEKAKVQVLIDAEESWIQVPVDELADAAMEACNKTTPIVYNTFQLYRHDRLLFLRQSFDVAQQRGYLLGAKLVRGAYMEKERRRAEEMGYSSPIQPDKASADRDYDEAVTFCMERIEKLGLFIGTHNEKSCMLAARLASEKGVPANHPHLWFSQLYGMSDNISFNLAASGYHVVKYLPYGPVEDVMPYLMRRAQENTSVAGQTGRELSLIRQELRRRSGK